MQAIMADLTAQWQAAFDEGAERMARSFSKESSKFTDAQMRKTLADAGFTVRFTPTPAQIDVLRASVHENVALIKSIPQQYLKNVEGLVMRSVQRGRDLSTLYEDLQKQHGVTRRRAALIARDQNNKATSVFQETRRKELGITQAIWMHSHGGKTPRPTHVAMDGKLYDVNKGMWDSHEGKFVFPGQLINCFPGDEVVHLDRNIRTLWRSFFDGPMVHIRVGADLLKGTFNHPILTSRGWLPMNEVQCGDDVVCMAGEGGGVVRDQKDHTISFADLFDAASRVFVQVRRDARGFNFHGQIPDDDVDEIEIVDQDLLLKILPSLRQDEGDLSFAKSNGGVEGSRLSRSLHVTHADGPSFTQKSSSLIDGGAVHTSDVRVASIAHHTVPLEDLADIGGGVSRKSQLGCYSGGAVAELVKPQNNIGESGPVDAPINGNPLGADLLGQFVGIAADRGCRSFACGTTRYEFRRVIDKAVGDFSGHVYTMETGVGVYSVGAARIQAKNCRCVSKSVIPALKS
ncbi:MAG: hypothetical protein JSS57_07280 [Proteobacteria bacterium]|nr:hypothetical protein [Pseudomonadota bacterium]